jgi:hypothetical protein
MSDHRPPPGKARRRRQVTAAELRHAVRLACQGSPEKTPVRPSQDAAHRDGLAGLRKAVAARRAQPWLGLKKRTWALSCR